MKTRLLSPEQTNDKSPAVEEKILKPLKQLEELLVDLIKIIARLKINFGLIKEMAAPSFSNKFLTLIGQKKGISEENKAVFAGLIAQVDPNNQLFARLNILQEQFTTYCSVVNNAKESMRQLIEDSPKQISHHIETCAENLVKEFEADYGRYIEAMPILSEYLESEEKCQRHYQWIDADLTMVKSCVDKAIGISKQVKELTAQRTKSINLDGHSLRKIETLKVKLEDEQPFLAIENIIEGMLRSACELLKISDDNLSLSAMKKEVEEDLRRLQGLLECYKRIEAEYIALDTGRIQQDASEIRRTIDEFLQETEIFNNKNKEKIFNCLRSYLEYTGPEEDAAQLDTEAQLSKFMLERAKIAENLKIKALSTLARETQFQREQDDIQRKLRELNEESTKSIFSEPQLEWSQPEKLLFEKLSERWSVGEVHRRVKFIDDELSLLNKKEIDLIMGKYNFNLLIDSNESLINDLLQCLSADASCGLDGSIQHLKSNYYQPILDQIKNLSSQLSDTKEVENQLDVLCKKIAKTKAEYDRNNFCIEKAKKACELLQRQALKFNININSVIEIEKRWKDLFQNGSNEFAMAFAGFKLSPKINEKQFRADTDYINTVSSGFPLTIALPIDDKFDYLKEYADCIIDINLLIELLKNIKNIFGNGLTKNYFNQLSAGVHQILKIDELLKLAVDKQYVNFSLYYNKREWPNIDAPRKKFTSLDLSYPAQLKRNIELLKQNLANLYGHQALQSQIISDQEKLKSYISLINADLSALNNYKNYIDFYNLAYNSHKKWASIARKKVAEIERVLTILVAQKDAFGELASNNRKCLHLIPSLEESIRLIVKRRHAVTEELKNNTLSDWFNKLRTAVKKINDEETFANSTKLLLKNLSNLKRKEKNIPREIFSLLRQEFIFSGKSKEIIEKLKSHGELALHKNRAKGKLIIDFINNLTNSARITNSNHMANFLADKNNKELIQNTGYSNMLEYSSTTGGLLNELRTVWMGLVRRENEGNRGSIRYALNQDYSQIRKEYQQALKEKKITIQVDAAVLKYTYERFAPSYLVDVTDDHLPVAVWKKIQQDYIEIQRWSGVDKTGLSLRHIRMQCARLIREAEDLFRHQDGLQSQLKLMAKNHPFTFAYHSLKCHLEKYPSNREGSKKKLWRMLDELAFGEGDESYKYGKMRESILEFYKNLREKPNGSAGLFFGKGSKLGDGLEAFLKMPQSPAASYEWGLGYEADQIHHRQPDTGVDKVTRWVRDQIFCCIPR